MTPIDLNLNDLAGTAGIAIEYVDLPEGRDGEYLHGRKLIRLRPGMSSRLHRSVLAHELGHAAFGDVPSMFGPVAAKQERRAEEWGALRLIALEDYRSLEQMHGGHPGAIAIELGVMRSTVIAFQNVLERIGETTYVQPRMGAGQFAARTVAASYGAPW